MLRKALGAGAQRVASACRAWLGEGAATAGASARYWTGYHVDAPEQGFSSVAESLAHYRWRNGQYPGYLEQMPVDAADSLVVLDYGCGPGNDVIGFGEFSKPERLHALDVSATALALARRRAQLHDLNVEFQQIPESPVGIPLEDNSVDLVHSSGVIHHTPDPGAILREFRRVLRADGSAQIMVYHRDSLWMHLHVAYAALLVENLYPGLSKEDAFTRTVDGDDCPIANCYSAEEFIALAEANGFRAELSGVSMSLLELQRLPLLWSALQDRRLDPESRQFLESIRFNERGWPTSRGRVAGINACYRLRPA